MLNFANRLLKLQKSIHPLSSSSSSASTILGTSLFITGARSRLFHSSFKAMVAQKIDGTAIAKYALIIIILTFIDPCAN